ncbi:MAG: fumarate hydratase C-terminal domain-containing protein [Rhodospirillaceae bacterium]|nr:fumarate hydratase C-terminal domain-containing protein [Rhodospirillaceae bacterium]
MKEIRLKLPVTPEDLAKLEAGMIVYLDGPIYTGREGLYRRVLDEGLRPPVDLASVSNVNFHCSPAAAVRPDGSYDVGAVTATASFRFSKWMSRWFDVSGCRMVIGKGGMSEEDYRNHFVPKGAVYLTTVGYGTGALLGRGIKKVRAVHWLEELGIAQAMWVFEVENFGPFLVDGDLMGNSLFEIENRKVNEKLADAYKGLKEPALRRYGETTSRKDEVI